MALAVVYRPLADLVPYARNARLHSRVSVAKLQDSLAEFGWTNPMLTAENEMIAGHGRLAAALALRDAGVPIPGNDDPNTGPTVDLSHLSLAQRRAYILTDNRLALDSDWSNDLLAVELTGLREDGFNLALTGFELADLDNIFAPDLVSSPIAVSFLASEPKSEDRRDVIVRCRDAAHQREVCAQLRELGLEASNARLRSSV